MGRVTGSRSSVDVLWPTGLPSYQCFKRTCDLDGLLVQDGLDRGPRADGYTECMELAPLTDDEIQRLLYPRRRAVGPGSFIATIRIPDGSEKDHEITAGTYDGGRLIADRIADSSHGIVSGFRRAAG